MMDTLSHTSGIPEVTRKYLLVPHALHCIECGRVLQGFFSTGKCPTCGTSIARSLRGSRLDKADASWVRKLRNALWILLLQCILAWISIIAALAVIFVATLQSRQSVMRHMQSASTLEVGAFAANIVVTVFLAVGVGMLTVPEPNTASSGKWGYARALTMLTLLWGYGGPLLGQGISLSVGSGAQHVVSICGGMLSLMAPIAVFCVLGYLRTLAIRLPNDQLARDTGVVMWGESVALAVVVTCQLIVSFWQFCAWKSPELRRGTLEIAAVGEPWRTISTIGGCMAIIAMGAAGVFGVWYLILLMRYSSAIGTVVR